MSLLRLFLLGVTVQRSPQPPVGAGARCIPRDAGKRGETQDRDKCSVSPRRVVRREEPKPTDESEGCQSGSPGDAGPGKRRPPGVSCRVGSHVAPRSLGGMKDEG